MTDDQWWQAIKRVARVCGALAAVSTLFWITTGMGWWSLVHGGDVTDSLRGALIFTLHVGALAVGVAACIEP